MGFSLFQLFKKPDVQQLDAFYRNLNLDNYKWTAFAVNQRTLEGSLLTRELAMSGDSPSFSWQTAEVEDGIFHLVNQGKKAVFNGKVTFPEEKEQAKKNFNQLVDRLIERELTFFQQGFKEGKQSLRQLEAEERALEWIRVSFDVLSRGIVESLTNPDYLFQNTLFAGINPKTGKREIRLMTFNLDMTFILLDDNDLRVIIYNKVPNVSLEELKPALSGDYSARKREIIDHLTALLAVLSKGFHL